MIIRNCYRVEIYQDGAQSTVMSIFPTKDSGPLSEQLAREIASTYLSRDTNATLWPMPIFYSETTLGLVYSSSAAF